MPAIIDLACVVVDCAEAAPLAVFYQSACGGEIFRSDDRSAWLKVAGVIIIFREVDEYQPPTWPSAQVPMQAHLDFNVDDLDAAEAQLHRFGAATPDYQPHRDNGLVVMRDPAGHLFCIGTRVELP